MACKSSTLRLADLRALFNEWRWVQAFALHDWIDLIKEMTLLLYLQIRALMVEFQDSSLAFTYVSSHFSCSLHMVCSGLRTFVSSWWKGPVFHSCYPPKKEFLSCVLSALCRWFDFLFVTEGLTADKTTVFTSALEQFVARGVLQLPLVVWCLLWLWRNLCQNWGINPDINRVISSS